MIPAYYYPKLEQRLHLIAFENGHQHCSIFLDLIIQIQDSDSPPNLNSALACAESLSFLAMHWYTPLSARCTAVMTSCSPLFCTLTLAPATPAPRGTPLCSHSRRGAGQPPHVQLMIAVPPLFTTWGELYIYREFLGYFCRLRTKNAVIPLTDLVMGL